MGVGGDSGVPLLRTRGGRQDNVPAAVAKSPDNLSLCLFPSEPQRAAVASRLVQNRN